MNNIEKVRHALAICDECNLTEKYCRAQGCPYIDRRRDGQCIGELHRDVKEIIGTLKEQEPRVLTLEEVKAFNWDYCYLEEERLPGKEYRAVCGDYALTCITWPCVTSMRIQHGDESYGRKWRCWSARPTDEQRKAVKWE